MKLLFDNKIIPFKIRKLGDKDYIVLAKALTAGFVFCFVFVCFVLLILTIAKGNLDVVHFYLERILDSAPEFVCTELIKNNHFDFLR